MKRAVTLRICSRSDAQEIVQRAEGDVYVQGGAVYVRYRESDPAMGATFTTLKLQPDRIKLIRRGDVESEQEFVPNRRLRGVYGTSQGKLALETCTHALTLELDRGIGTAAWSYDLTIMGEPAGRFELRIDIVPLEAT